MESYEGLRVWQVGMEIAEQCYKLTGDFPRAEAFGMSSQIRRAASSIPANIAEGYGRNKRGDYLQFLRIARGSLFEVTTHLKLSVRVGLLSEDLLNSVLPLCEEESRMLTTLIKRVESSTAHEDPAEYIV